MRLTRHRRLIVPAAVIAAAGLALTGCTGDIAQQDAADVDCSDYEEYGTFEGAEVALYGTIVEEEGDRLNDSFADFETCTGIDVVYEGSQEFETQINVRAQGGNPPDLAIFPQPGLLGDLARGGYLVPAPEAVEANVDEFWSEDWKAYGTVDDTFYGSPLMASVKGYVWYSPAAFEENGWEIPESLDDLMTLTADIAASGTMKPWCAGFGSDAATGWPGTDWVEDMVLRLHGPEVYDQWVAHEIPFNDPRIVEAFDAVGEILKNEEYVNGGYGGVSSIVSTTFGDGGLPILDQQCAMHHQASFYEGFWPEGTEVASDGDVWAFLTPAGPEGGQAVTGGGEIVGAFTDREEVQAVQQFMSSDTWANERVSLGGVVSANSGLDPSNASSPLLEQTVEILQDPETTFRFDGSDLMPGAVGANSFWKGIVDWISGQSTQQTVDFIEQSWPTS